MHNPPADTHALQAATARLPLVLPVISSGDARFDCLCVTPLGPWQQLIHWLPAMGVPARHYLPLAEAMAARGVAMAIHEWRGVGSSNQRAGRRCNWGYRELLSEDLPAASAAIRQRWPHAGCWLGGHSLGGQLGLLYASLQPQPAAGVVLIASGSPYWRCFRQRRLIGAAYLAAPPVARLWGYLPGRRIGFGGNEARGVIADWARSGRNGRYAATGMTVDFEALLASLQLPVLSLSLAEDWLAPAASLDWLLGKLPQASRSGAVIHADELGGQRADHFGWMKMPFPLAARIDAWMAGDGGSA
jgi:predicted alpha/beta hydrolase